MDIGCYFDQLDRHLQAGRGVCLYACGKKDARSFADRLSRAGRPVSWVCLCDQTPPGPWPDVVSPTFAGCVVFQGLSMDSLQGVVGDLVGRLVYPCYLHGKPLFFFSAANRGEYLSRVRAEDLHTCCQGVLKGLRTEQLAELLARMSFQRAPAARVSPGTAAPAGDPGVDSAASGAVPPLPVDGNLDANQQRAASHLAGPIRVLAPAGSGKTKTLINRIAHLVNCGVRPASILALAFNRKAALEMQQRLAGVGVPVADRLDGDGAVIRTFHSFGNEIVKDHLGWRLDQRPGESPVRQCLRQAVDELHPAPRGRGHAPLDAYVQALTRTRMELPPVTDVTVSHAGQTVPFAPIFARYLELQTRRRFLDFDDMVYQTLRALLSCRDLRRSLQDRFEYLLVDEFQDLNRAQMLLMQTLALPQDNLFVVGDDDQMIYGWRGAEVRHILDFGTAYPEAADCLLSTNYRSTRCVIHHARWLIDHNRERVPKDIRPRPQAPPGDFDIRLGDSLLHQARDAADWVAARKQDRNLDWRDFAVLFRCQAHQFIVAVMLQRRGIPHSPVDEGRLFRTSVGRDLRSYLRLILRQDQAAPADFATVLTRPNRFLSRAIVGPVTDWSRFQQAPAMEGLEPWQAQRLRGAVDSVLNLRRRLPDLSRSAAGLLSALAEETGLRPFYGNATSPSPPPNAAGEDVLLEVILAVAAQYPSAEAFLARLDHALGAGNEADPEPADRSADAVTLSTIHSTKGNEYAHVVYYNLGEFRAAGPEGMEEERRVAYVGVTRAIDSILITAPKERTSPFVEEVLLNPEFADLSTHRLAVGLRWARLRSSRLAIALAGNPRAPGAARLEDMAAELRHRRALGRRSCAAWRRRSAGARGSR